MTSTTPSRSSPTCPTRSLISLRQRPPIRRRGRDRDRLPTPGIPGRLNLRRERYDQYRQPESAPAISVSISPRSPGLVPRGGSPSWTSRVTPHRRPKNSAGTRAAGTPLSAARKTLIEQMERGHREIPQISISRNLDVTPLEERREGISFTAILIHHIARALVGHEALRTVLRGDRLRVGPVDIAVAMDTPRGLFAPVVRRADRLEIEEISKVIRQYRKRAGENRLKGEELRHGPFAVTNLGMFGVDLFTPLIFAGQTAVLAVGRATEVEDGRISAWVTLAVDHRVVDGAEAARFLETLRREIAAQ